MLHSAVKRPDAAHEVAQKKKNGATADKRSDARADISDEEYDYEDDFEVKKRERSSRFVLVTLSFVYFRFPFLIEVMTIYSLLFRFISKLQKAQHTNRFHMTI